MLPSIPGFYWFVPVLREDTPCRQESAICTGSCAAWLWWWCVVVVVVMVVMVVVVVVAPIAAAAVSCIVLKRPGFVSLVCMRWCVPLFRIIFSWVDRADGTTHQGK
jgi:hypothetical protein